jgi:hypothetical protein
VELWEAIRATMMQQVNKYEIAIYNERVRTAVRQAERNKTGLSKDWADMRYIEVRAESQEAARQKIFSRFPQDRGFVIEEIRLLEEG